MRRALTALPAVVMAMAVTGCGVSGDTPSPAAAPPPRPEPPLSARPSLTLDEGAPTIRTTPLGSGFVRPVALLREPGSRRTLVVEQSGTARWLLRGRPAPGVPFLDLRSEVEFEGEQGLLGAVFLPDYGRDPRIAVHYIDHHSRSRVVVFRVFGGVVDRFSGQDLLTVEQPYGNHNGGQLVVGPDRRLYVGLGDGGSAYDPRQNGQNLDVLLGKLLRYDLDRPAVPPAALTVPDGADDDRGARIEARTQATNARWQTVAYGLRDPWRLSFDATTGDIWIADTGRDRAQRQTQEVDRIEASRLRNPKPPVNFGWAGFDGIRDQINRELTLQGPLEWPVASFVPPRGCGIVGGVVVRAGDSPLDGRYLFGNQCSGQVWSVPTRGRLPLAMRREGVVLRRLTAFLAAPDGSVLIASADGRIVRAVARADARAGTARARMR